MSCSKSIIIYKLISPSGKVYIGQSNNINKRFQRYSQYSDLIKNQVLLYRSIKKYRLENFKIEILNVGLNQEEANIREKEYIAYYKNLEISLNILDGGNTVNAQKRPIALFTKKGNFIKTFDEIQQALDFIGKGSVSSVSCCLKYKRYYAYGYLWIDKEDYIKGFIPKYKGFIPKNKRKILNITDNIEFNSITEAANYYNINVSNISNCLSGKCKKAYNKKWRYIND